MTALLPRIDHVVINVRDRLDEAAGQYRRLGFHLTPRGHHSLGSSNNLAIFGSDYLELLGHEPGRGEQRAALWQTPVGLSGLVFKPPASADFAAELQGRGVPAEPPLEFFRPVALADGAREARFQVVNIPGAVANGRVFFCRHFTPDLVWRDEWRTHPNGVRGIAAFVIATDDPERSAATFKRIFGETAFAAIQGGLALAAGEATVRLLHHAEVARRYGAAVPGDEDGGERMVALDLRVASLATTRAVLDGKASVIEESDRIIVPADAAFGVALSFQP